MDHSEVLDILRPQWRAADWAKSTGELLWTHHYTVWSVGRKLARLAPSIDAPEARLLALACLTHDIGKRDSECQRRLRDGQAPGDHKLDLEQVTAYFRRDLADTIPVSDADLAQIAEIARTHHSVSQADIRAQQFDRAGLLGRLLITADWIGSMDEPDFDTLARLPTLYAGRLDFSYFRFSRFPSPTSFLVVRVGLEQYRDKGWDPLVVVPQGAVFVAKAGANRPLRSDVAALVEREVIRESLALQASVPTGYTGDFLTLLSKEYPDLFLTGNAERIRDELGSQNRAVVFLKLARDILSARGLVDEAAKGACSLLSLVDSANSTSAHPTVKAKYAALFGRDAPEKVNRDMLDPLFAESRVRDIVPAGRTVPLEGEEPLRTATADQLFAVLAALAAQGRRTADDGPSRLEEYLKGALLLEEELDFAEIASEIFRRYKVYKQTSDAEKGVCERCACPVTAKMQPGLNFATAPQAFSQIKPKYQYRAVCPLCGYDNLVVRKDVRSGTSWVYARIETKVPDLLTNLPDLENLINRVVAGIRRPRQFLRLEEIPELGRLPFPGRLTVPLSDAETGKLRVHRVPLNERGVLLRLSVMDTNRGPKDLRGEFEPVFHILNFLGFQVALGSEEQDGLFGQRIPTTPENYLRSLAVVLLASVVDKTANRFVFASELIERSPAVALSYAAGDGRDRFGLKAEFLAKYLEYVVQANVRVTSQKGDVGMKGLLKDAAFLAPSLVDAAPDADEDALGLEDDDDTPEKRKRKRRGGMWSFCEHKDGEMLSKHSATKAISQALDELMLGRGVDFAVNKFLQNVSRKISAERTGELAEFLAGVQGIIERAERIRQQDITDFLRYKNALLSAVFMFTRYPDLKAVLATDKE
jgi:hypothetical protein